MKIVESKDHIMIFDDVVSKRDCNTIIRLFNLSEYAGNCTKERYSSGVNSLRRNDFAMGTWDFPMVNNFVNTKVYECFELYKNQFFQIESVNIDFDEVKIQNA